MNSRFKLAALATGLLSLGAALGQDLSVQGDGASSGTIFQAKNICPVATDRIAIQGHSVPVAGRGIGVKGIGGWKGISAVGSSSGVGSRFGAYGSAGNGVLNHAIKGGCTGSTGVNIAILGEASGANSRAGLFYGALEYTGTLWPPSDRKLKKDVKDLKHCLKTVSRLTPREYDFRADEYPEMNLSEAHQFGMIAQEVEAVLPDLVSESAAVPSMADEEEEKGAKLRGLPVLEKAGYKNMNYMGLIPIILGAVKEQQAQLDALSANVDKLKK